MYDFIISTGVIGIIGAALAAALEAAHRFIANYGECEVDINSEKRVFRIEGGGSLLSSLSNEKIFIPSACGGRGSCGLCKVKVEAGAGPVLSTETPHLSPDEIKNSVRLSCQVKIRNDVRIHIPDELFYIKEFAGTVESIRDLTYDIKELRIKLVEPDTIEFKSGQYMQLTVPEYGDMDEPVYRAYSMSNPQSDQNHVEFIIRYVPEGFCTTWVHKMLKEGDEVTLNGPHGDFYIRDTDRPVIMIAGGSGMAPMKGMLLNMAEKGSERPTVFFFGAHNAKDVYHMDLMRDIESRMKSFRFVPAVSKVLEDEAWDGERGRITDVIDTLTENAVESEAYLCGSPGMIKACVGVLTKKGLSEERIYYDKFA